jgi:hypothetical protein
MIITRVLEYSGVKFVFLYRARWTSGICLLADQDLSMYCNYELGRIMRLAAKEFSEDVHVEVAKKEEVRPRFKREKVNTNYPPVPMANSRGYVYILELVERSGEYKIGRSKRPHIRIRDINRIIEVKPIHVAFVDSMHRTEKDLHRQYSSKRIKGEWFQLTHLELAEAVETLKKLTISR